MSEGHCEHPKCHENLKLSMSKLVTKHTLWVALAVVGIPLLATGVKVWSQQEADHLRYADKESMNAHERRLMNQEATVKHMADDIKTIQRSQDETRKDIKEILRYMRRTD